MADPRATADFPSKRIRFRGVPLPVMGGCGALGRPARHAYAGWTIRLSAIAFCHNPNTYDALFKETVTGFAREGVWA